jgi:uncharacterized Ntn-hydrolase superfamily protein
MSASQGASASTLLGEQMLAQMNLGESPDAIIKTIQEKDQGLEYRQISMLSIEGQTAVYSGKSNESIIDDFHEENFVTSGNMLGGDQVISSIKEYFQGADANLPLAERLLECLKQGAQAGGDKRGLLSAAMLILHPDQAPLTLRIDHHEDPITQLDLLYQKVTSGDYYEWTKTVPTQNNPYRYK